MEVKLPELDKRAYVVGAAVLLALVYFVLSSGNPAKETIQKLAKAVRNDDIETVVSLIHPEYRGLFGNSKDELAEFVRLGMNATGNVKLMVKDMEEIAASDERITVLMQYKVSGRYGGRPMYFVGTPLATEPIVMEVAQTPEGWKVIGFKNPEDDPRANDLMEQYERKLRGSGQ